MPTNASSLDIGHFHRFKRRQMVCGDTFLFRRIREEKRSIAVLSDGLGSGVKANVLSTLTATMALNYTAGFHNIKKSAETIMRTLLVCSERRISYATFTIVDIDAAGEALIINYDNPSPLIIREGRSMDIEPAFIEGKVRSRGYRLSFMRLNLLFGDRIVLFSDGVSQAGMGTRAYPLGWGADMAAEFVCEVLANAPDCPARRLAGTIVERALEIDSSIAHDDITCGVIHYRRPRELLIVTGPPVDRGNDCTLANRIREFNGSKVICGGTTAKIIARELDRKISCLLDNIDSPLPPKSHIDGIDLVTEGIITLHTVERLLQSGKPLEEMEDSAAKELVEKMIECDTIHFLTGTKINEVWEDPDLPTDIGLRRTIVSRIAKVLENVYQKETTVSFI